MTKKEQQSAALDALRSILNPGDTVTTVIRSVSRSGMSRSIDCYVLSCKDGTISKRWLSRLVATALGYSFDEKHEAVKVSGCGMDMGFHLVYNLSYALFGEGMTVSQLGRDPGYDLKQEWL